VFPLQFSVVLLRRFQGQPFAAVRLVRKKSVVDFPAAAQPDKKAVGALFRLINPGNAFDSFATVHQTTEND
jgi:hypothetical protein